MRQSSKRLCCLWLSAVVIAFADAEPRVILAAVQKQSQSAEATNALMDQIFADWQLRRERAKSISFSVAGTTVVPKGTFDGDVDLAPWANGVALSEDYHHPFAGSWLIDFSQNRFRTQLSYELFNISHLKFHPVNDLYVFDGSELVCHRVAVSENRGTHYGKLQPEFVFNKLNEPVLHIWSAPVFFAVGLVLPDDSRGGIRNLKAPVEHTHFLVEGRGVVDGRDCVVLRKVNEDDTSTGVLNQFWVDVDRDSAVVRAEVLIEREVNEMIDVSYEETENGWMPISWVCKEFNGDKPKLPTRITTVKAENTNLNVAVADDNFVLKPEPGMIVRNARTGKSFRLGNQGEQLPLVALNQSEQAGFRRTLVFVTAAICLALLIVVIYRRIWPMRSVIG